MSKETKVILAVCLFIIAAALALLSSCNPVKRVLLDDEKYKIVTDKFVSEGGCVNDTIWSSPDSVVVFDTLYQLDFKTDTMLIDKMNTIIKTQFKTVVKTVTIKDTAVVTDRAKENLLNSKITHQYRKIKELEQKVKDEQINTKEQRQRANKWVFNFWALIVAAGIYIFRKPLLQLITKIKI